MATLQDLADLRANVAALKQQETALVSELCQIYNTKIIPIPTNLVDWLKC